MKKILLLTITIFSIFLMHSCFLFKPVQKTCPAYSLNQIKADNIELISTKDNNSDNVKSM